MTDWAADVDGVLFDIDDTLVDTAHGWQHAVNAACRYAATRDPAVDPEILAAVYRETSDALWKDFDRRLAPFGSIALIRRHVWREALRVCRRDLPDAWLSRLVETFTTAQLAAIHADPAIRDLLHQLAHRRRIAVCTNNEGANSRAKLHRAGLLPLFDVIVCGIDERVRKPHPALFHRACHLLGVEPARCLYVGDDWRNDIVGAYRAGLKPIWIQPNSVPAPSGRPPLARYPNVAEALRVIVPALSLHANRPT